jgi:hypothetical protein
MPAMELLSKEVPMECLYDDHVYDDYVYGDPCDPVTVAVDAQDYACARGVFYGLLFVVPFWVAIIAAIKAF